MAAGTPLTDDDRWPWPTVHCRRSRTQRDAGPHRGRNDGGAAGRSAGSDMPPDVIAGRRATADVHRVAGKMGR